MINPSAIGWIDKFFSEQNPLPLPVVVYPEKFYKKSRATGFIYGHVIGFDTAKSVSIRGLTSEEISKVALLNTLYNVFGLVTHESNPEIFIEKAVAFYKEMSPEGFNLLKKVLPENAASVNLEKIIDDRVQTNENFVSRNFSHILTNALLFEDVLAFRKYLIHDAIPHNYLKKLEETIVSIVSLALNTKSRKTEYDDLLIKLFEASVRFTKFSKVDVQTMESLEFHYFDSDLEQFYLLDLAVLAMWNDQKVDDSEALFLKQLAGLLNLNDDIVAESTAATEKFIQKYKSEIPYFNYSNPVKHFYDHSTQAVITLITRNKNRLIKELSNNGELMLLLTHSTHRHLEDKEKKKVKKQLLEICKTIPSLTIFLLPGGSLLLPILIKFIPKMLPTAFNENLEEG
ncbi:LETM1-related biofilm-associated protein [Flavobacterium sp. 3HN19-14]|uniref:LETM1-related biofilm-associated protein n=1 Tax=Flavobacterium sp. 3HN19-14 TaxID=3448133 RepID=UPI003EE33397